MRKIYYFAVAAVFMTMSFSGCSSDEVTVKEPEPEQTTTLPPDDQKENQDNGQSNNENQNDNSTEITVKTRNMGLTDAQKQAVGKNNDFAFNFYRQLIQQPDVKGKSIITSPLSVTYAIGMLNDGAKGKTSEEITSMLVCQKMKKGQ